MLRVLNRCLSVPTYRNVLQGLLERWLEPRSATSEILGFLPGLVVIACEGTIDQAVSASAAWRVLRLAAKWLDDVQDGDAGPTWPITISEGLALIFFSRLIVADMVAVGVSPEAVSSALSEMDRACLLAAMGQRQDLCAVSYGASGVHTSPPALSHDDT
ncbi:MAG: hypothetical protein H5T69_17785, partial [Chloroflexi bacterium]|nr:hypothetical protein [Chloroflexota bacterium]